MVDKKDALEPKLVDKLTENLDILEPAEPASSSGPLSQPETEVIEKKETVKEVQEKTETSSGQPVTETQKSDDVDGDGMAKLILYIEDNQHNRRIVRKILEHHGYQVEEAEDGLVGLQKIQDLIPPLVLLDIALPGIDGLEVLKRVREDDKLRDIPVIALTASAMRGDREKFLAAGCDDYLSKPIRAADLVNMVDSHHPEH